MKRNKYWEFSFGFYPGILFGFRTYQQEPEEVKWEGDDAYLTERNHVFYIPFVDVCYKLMILEKQKTE